MNTTKQQLVDRDATVKQVCSCDWGISTVPQHLQRHVSVLQLKAEAQSADQKIQTLTQNLRTAKRQFAHLQRTVTSTMHSKMHQLQDMKTRLRSFVQVG